MLVIGEAVIEDDVLGSEFACDLHACKGACCVLQGGRGAPLADHEVLEVEKAYPAVASYLPGRHRERIAAAGLWDGCPGDYVTTCVDDRECVFVYYDTDIARCSFERAYQEGLTDWRKPLSCHLFPLRIGGWQRDHVRYEQIDECEEGRRRGAEEHVRLTDFLKEPLIRAYGEGWYRRLVKQISNEEAPEL